MRIAVCSYAIGDVYKEIVKYGVISRKEYCRNHHYDYIDDETEYDHTRPIEWTKIPTVKKYMDRYDYIVWMDADSLIMNPEISLEYFIKKYMQNEIEMMYVSDGNWINTGIFFVKCTEYMKKFLTEVYKYPNEMCKDQGAIDYLWRNNWNNCRQKIYIVPDQTEYNSSWRNYFHGDFIIHFPGCNEPNRPENSLRRMMSIFSPVKMDEETTTEYDFRISWLKECHKDLEHYPYPEYLPLAKFDPKSTHKDILECINQRILAGQLR